MDFEKIYRDYFSYIYKFVFKLSGSSEIAEEITSETFLKALKSVNDFRGDCSVSSWLCQIAKNCFYSYARKNKIKIYFDDDTTAEAADQGQSAEDECISRSEAERAREYLHELSEPYKEVFMWRYYGEMGFRQIGELFRKDENWACVTYYRARKMIREKMEGRK